MKIKQAISAFLAGAMLLTTQALTVPSFADDTSTQVSDKYTPYVDYVLTNSLGQKAYILKSQLKDTVPLCLGAVLKPVFYDEENIYVFDQTVGYRSGGYLTAATSTGSNADIEVTPDGSEYATVIQVPGLTSYAVQSVHGTTNKYNRLTLTSASGTMHNGAYSSGCSLSWSSLRAKQFGYLLQYVNGGDSRLSNDSILSTTTPCVVTKLMRPAELITAAVTQAFASVTDDNKDTYLAAVKDKVTLSGNQVLYNGSAIGYWTLSDPDVIYTDETKTSKLLEKSGTTYKVSPAFSPILADVNNKFTFTYTNDNKDFDWSKIIGKYDVSLGGVTLPATNWVELTPSADTTYNTSNDYFDLTQATEVTPNRQSNVGWYFAYGVTTTGDLYICSDIELVATNYSDEWTGYLYGLTHDNVCIGSYPTVTNEGNKYYKAPLLKLGMIQEADRVYPVAWSVDECNTYIGKHANKFAMYNITNSSSGLGDIDSLQAVGIVWLPASGFTTDATAYKKFFGKQSYTVKGIDTITNRLSKLSQLDPTSTVSLAADGWYVNDSINMDDYLLTTALTNAGDVANINASADIEPARFNVVVPTTLPIYVDEDGKVSVASNATVENKSCSPVVVKEVLVAAKQSSGWTLIDTEPSVKVGAKEFNFSVSLKPDTVLDKDAVLPFTYAAKLSPSNEGVEALDIASVMVTIDWEA